MAYEQKDGSGALFKNDRKEPGSNQPDYRGDANVNGEVVEIAAWIKPKANGGNFMSLSFKPKSDYKGESKKANPADMEDDDADIPF